MIQPYIDQLLQFVAPETDDIVAAKAEFFALSGGEVFADDRCYEQRMQAFFNWYLFDRKGPTGRTPAERFLAEKGAELLARDRELLEGCAKSQLSLFEYKGTRGLFSKPQRGQVRVLDVLSGDKLDVTERRQMLGLSIGDLFEARLVPAEGTWHFSTSFTFHPREAKPAILREIKRRRKEGSLDPRGLVFELQRMALQQERFRNVGLANIYNFDAPFLSRRGRAEA